MDFLTIENPHIGADVNILVIMDHFTWYAKAVVTPNQPAKAMATAFWNEFITNYGFPEKLLTNHGCNFEFQLIKKNCANWPTSERCEQHLIIQKLTANPKFQPNSNQYDQYIGNQTQATLERLPSHTSVHLQLYQK